MSYPLPAVLRLLLTLVLLGPALVAAAWPAGPSQPVLPAAAPFTSAVPTPAAPSTARLTLSLAADPPWAAAGEVVTCTVTAANAGDAVLAGLTLTAALPEGLVYVAGSAVGFTYTASGRQLTWRPAPLAAHATLSGRFQARVTGLALGSTVTTMMRSVTWRASATTASCTTSFMMIWSG